MTDDVYHKVGETLIAHFLARNGLTKITGLVQGDFDIDIARDGVGNQASTGVTIDEVDSVNNPGVYKYEVNGLTGYVKDTGSFIATLRTATPTTIDFVDKRIVTSDGTGGGTIGAAFFASSNGDGRVTDGTNPIEDATVFFRNAAGQLITSLQTDSNGDYSVYLDETVTVYAQKTNFTQATGTITVSGSTATGPGTNLVLTSTAGSGTITYGQLLSYARRVAGDQTGSHADTILGECVNDALMMLGNDHEWLYLHRDSVINVNARYNTGTIDVTQDSPTITLTGGVFPAWAANGQLRINNILYNVASRDSDTQLTLEDDYGQDTDTGVSYVLFQDAYDLPTDLVEIKGYHKGYNWIWGEIPISYDDFYELKSEWNFSSNQVQNFAIASGKIHIFPYPSEDGDFNITYLKRIGNYESDADIIDFDPIHKHLVHRAIDYQIAMRYGQTAGNIEIKGAEKAYRSVLNRAIDKDKQIGKRPAPDWNYRRGNRPFYKPGGFA